MATIKVDGILIDPTKVGSLPPPPGVIPNLKTPYSQTNVLVATIAVCLTVSTILIGGRVYTRLGITRQHGWNDYLSIAAWIGFVAYCAVALEENKWGIGAHAWNVSLARAPHAAKLANANEVFYAPLILITKLSILLLYIRIFMPTHQGFTYRATHALIWFNVLLYGSVMFVEIFQCTPRQKIWNPLLPGHCINLNVAFIATAAINIFSDFAMLILPLRAIWNLQMPSRRKWGVSAVFGTGVFACVSSIMRLIWSVKFSQTKDQTWESIPLGLWTMAEICSGITIGCLPVMPRFYSHFVQIASSKIRSYRASKSLKGSAAQTLSDHSTSSKRIKDTEGLYAPKGEYLELNENRSGATPGKPLGPGARGVQDRNLGSVLDADEEKGIKNGTISKV